MQKASNLHYVKVSYREIVRNTSVLDERPVPQICQSEEGSAAETDESGPHDGGDSGRLGLGGFLPWFRFWLSGPKKTEHVV